jgi:branched-chain amino acid transport system substrate-binding protein
MNSRSPRKAWKAAVIVAACLAAGCADDEIRVGAILPLSGTGELYGQSARKGIELAVEEINAQGGVRGKQLAVLLRDSRGAPSSGLEAALDLIDGEEVSAILGDLFSDVTLEVAALAEQRQVVLFSPGSSVPKLTQSGLYVFRNYPSDALEGAQVAQFASEKARLLDMVVVAVSNAYGQGLKEAFLRYYTGPNREVHKVINFHDGGPDEASIVSQIEELRPDGVYLIAYAPDRNRILEELRRRNIGGRLIGTRDSRDIILAAGAAVEGMVFPLDEYDPAGEDPMVREFVKAYRAKHNGETPGLWAAQAYDAARMVAKAIHEAEGTYGQAVQIRLSSIEEYRGVTGRIDLDANGDVARRPAIYVVQNGTFVLYDQIETGQAPSKPAGE